MKRADADLQARPSRDGTKYLYAFVSFNNGSKVNSIQILAILPESHCYQDIEVAFYLRSSAIAAFYASMHPNQGSEC